VLITGEVGTQDDSSPLLPLEARAQSAFVLYPALSAEELLKTILDERDHVQVWIESQVGRRSLHAVTAPLFAPSPPSSIARAA
jgi:hypothetical protein